MQARGMGRIFAFAAVVLLAGGAVRAEPACWQTVFEGAGFLVCTAEVGKVRLRTWLDDDAGRPLQTFARLRAQVEDRGERLLFAFNAGMFTPQHRPAGLYVEDGKVVKGINLRRGRGNFHLLPNGVFWIGKNRAGVMESHRFARAMRRGRLRPRFATQSGPMLVIGGRLHPKFRRGSDSRKIRNGVGVKAGGKVVVFALALDAVNFHTFARLFRDVLKTPDALFLDGGVSQALIPELGYFGGLLPLSYGPFVGAVAID